MTQTRIPCLLMRGGTSKGAYFLASDLPADPLLRDLVLLAVMGSPDSRQIDGIGGADSLTSKVAIIQPSARPDADVDYLFAQVLVDEPRVDYGQNCGNILSGVGPFALERGLVPVAGDVTPVRIYMQNSGQIAIAHVPTSSGRVCYSGDARIDGVPGFAAPLVVEFEDIAGASCGALLPTGNAVDVLDGVAVTCIDNGMPVVLLRAQELGCSGYESPAQLDADVALRARLESIRMQAGLAMNLGDVRQRNVPKMCLVPQYVCGQNIYGWDGDTLAYETRYSDNPGERRLMHYSNRSTPPPRITQRLLTPDSGRLVPTVRTMTPVSITRSKRPTRRCMPCADTF